MMAKCEWCKGTGEHNLAKCCDCGGSGEAPFTIVPDTRYQVRDLHALRGKTIVNMQVRDEGAVDDCRYGHAAYKILIEVEGGKVFSIAGDHDRGPDIEILDEMPPMVGAEEW